MAGYRLVLAPSQRTICDHPLWAAWNPYPPNLRSFRVSCQDSAIVRKVDEAGNGLVEYFVCTPFGKGVDMIAGATRDPNCLVLAELPRMSRRA